MIQKTGFLKCIVFCGSHIFYYIFSRAIDYTFTASNVNQDITNQFGVLDFVKVLNFKKWEEKKKGRDKYGCWYLSHEENEMIVFPISLIGKYLDYLSSIRILSKKNGNYAVVFNSVDDWESAFKDEKLRLQLSEQETQKENWLMIAQQKINRDAEQKATKISIKKRTVEMLAAELRL